MKKRVQRVLKLLIRFWIVMIFICCIGVTLGMRERLILNALLG